VFTCFKTKFGDVVLSILWRDGLQNTYRDEIFGFGQSLSHTHRPLKFIFEILGLPRLTACFFGSKYQRCIVDHGSWREPLFQGGGINEWLETGTGLPPCLSNMVELVLVEIKSANQRINCAVARITGNKSRFNLG